MVPAHPPRQGARRRRPGLDRLQRPGRPVGTVITTISVVVGGPEAARPADLALVAGASVAVAGVTALRVGESLSAVGAAVEDSLTGRVATRLGAASSRTTSGTASALDAHRTRRSPTTGSAARGRRSSTARRSASSRSSRWATRTTSCSTASDRRHCAHACAVPRAAHCGALGGGHHRPTGGAVRAHRRRWSGCRFGARAAFAIDPPDAGCARSGRPSRSYRCAQRLSVLLAPHCGRAVGRTR